MFRANTLAESSGTPLLARRWREYARLKQNPARWSIPGAKGPGTNAESGGFPDLRLRQQSHVATTLPLPVETVCRAASRHTLLLVRRNPRRASHFLVFFLSWSSRIRLQKYGERFSLTRRISAHSDVNSEWHWATSPRQLPRLHALQRRGGAPQRPFSLPGVCADQLPALQLPLHQLPQRLEPLPIHQHLEPDPLLGRMRRSPPDARNPNAEESLRRQDRFKIRDIHEVGAVNESGSHELVSSSPQTFLMTSALRAGKRRRPTL